jgi:Mrp family chromosome partitioning ATPase
VHVLRQYFDYVVLDSPPLTNVSDARILAAKTDAVIVVVKAFSTSRHLVKRAVDQLKESRSGNIAVILNDVDVNTRTKYYSYYSGRYYHPSNYGATTPPA